jgi:hypothetical protein
LKALSKALENNVAVLSLNNNRIRDDGVIDLCATLISPSCAITELYMCSNPLTVKSIKSFRIALNMTKLLKLYLSFSEEDLKEVVGMEKKLIKLLCEAVNTHCAVNLGGVSLRLNALAKVQYHSHKAKQRQQQQTAKQEQPASWRDQLNPKLASFLNQKNTG